MEWLLLILGLALIVGTGFFVAVEFAMIAIDVPTVQRMVDAGDRGAEPLLRNTCADYAPRPGYRPQTKFETRGLRLGHGVWDLIFKRI